MRSHDNIDTHWKLAKALNLKKVGSAGTKLLQGTPSKISTLIDGMKALAEEVLQSVSILSGNGEPRYGGGLCKLQPRQLGQIPLANCKVGNLVAASDPELCI